MPNELLGLACALMGIPLVAVAVIVWYMVRLLAAVERCARATEAMAADRGRTSGGGVDVILR